MFDAIRNAQGERLDTAWHAPAGELEALVVIGHGVTANKDRAWAVTLAETLAERGYGALRFSFSGNGDSEGDFLDSCPTKEAADLGAVLDAVEGAAEELRIPEVVYVGHSMGAAVGVIRTSRDPRIARLVSLGGMVHTGEFVERKFGGQEPGELMWDKPECPLGQVFLDDMREIDSVAPLARDLSLPWLLVHGDADTVVPAQESNEIAVKAGGNAKVVQFEGVDHLFTDVERRMAETVCDWLDGK